MKLQIYRGGTPIGDFDELTIADGLSSGRLRPDDDYWAEGMHDWRKLSDFAATKVDLRPEMAPNDAHLDQLEAEPTKVRVETESVVKTELRSRVLKPTSNNSPQVHGFLLGLYYSLSFLFFLAAANGVGLTISSGDFSYILLSVISFCLGVGATFLARRSRSIRSVLLKQNQPTSKISALSYAAWAVAVVVSSLLIFIPPFVLFVPLSLTMLFDHHFEDQHRRKRRLGTFKLGC